MAVIAKFVRSDNVLVQAMCALVEIGPPTRGALDAKSFEVIDKTIDAWNAFASTVKEGDVFPSFLKRTAASLSKEPDWLSEPREVYTYDKQTGKYLNPFPAVAMASYDQSHVIKGMCVCAAASQHSSVVCGAPADLARYKVLWCNNVFSTKNGSIYVRWLREACFSGDTLALNVYADDTKIAALPNNHDVDVWTPFVLLSLKSGIKDDSEAIANHLFHRFGTSWSKPMINACLNVLRGTGYIDHMASVVATQTKAQKKGDAKSAAK